MAPAIMRNSSSLRCMCPVKTSRLEEARGDFVATVSHELRTPLASIHGAATTLRSRAEQLRPKTRSDLLEIVFEQSERLDAQ